MTQFLQPSPPATLAETLSVIDAVLASLAPRLPPHVSLEDLASAGKLALVEAMLRFDGPLCEARAYCYVRVRGAVLDELRRLDPLSRQARARVNQVRHAADALTRRLGRAPDGQELAAFTGLSQTQLRQVEEFVSVSYPVEEAADDIEDAYAASPAAAAESGDVCDSVHAALARMPVNQALALRLYYIEDATLDEIAGQLGVSRERARQIREAGEKRLRADFVVLALWQSLINQA